MENTCGEVPGGGEAAPINTHTVEGGDTGKNKGNTGKKSHESWPEQSHSGQ